MAQTLKERLLERSVDNLLMLVGNNPLPCFVTGKLLVNPGGTVYLVYTNETKHYAKRLAEALNSAKCKVDIQQGVSLSDARDPSSVFDLVGDTARNVAGSVGLHYTGGTKVMAVHAYRALLKAKPDAIFSYLDPDKLTMCFEQRGDTLGAPLRLEARETNELLELTLHQLWQIHDKTPITAGHSEFTERIEPLLPGVAELLAEEFQKGNGQQWIDTFIGEKALRDDEPLSHLPYNTAEKIKGLDLQLTTVGDMRKHLNNRTKNRANNYLGTGGDWVEDVTLQALKDLKNELALNDIVCSARAKKGNGAGVTDMELDVVAIRGYQLFVFSCYGGIGKASRETCKAKLYEAAMRAQQLGGSEARFALVCCQDEQRAKEKDRIAQQMSGTLSVRSFRVFDRNDLPTLKDALRRWINTVDRETR